MKKIANNLFKGQSLRKTFIELAELLGSHKHNVEQCYTYESLCRTLRRKKDIETYKQKIIDVNLNYCASSYDSYQMKNIPISHEFPIEKSNTPDDILLFYVDRYLGLIHLLMVVYNRNDIRNFASKAKELKEHINFIIMYTDAELSEHIKNVIAGEEYRLADLIADDIFTTVDCLELAIRYGTEKKECFHRVIKHYLMQNNTKKALKAYNEFYVPVFKTDFIRSRSELEKFLADAKDEA